MQLWSMFLSNFTLKF